MKLKKLKSLIAISICALIVVTTCPVSVSAAWKQDSTGWWNTEGNSYSIGWRSIDNTWYYFGSDGYMKTGWINDNGTWYYTDNSGAMKTGWINDNGIWYYTNASGAMQTGLVTINNNTYYLNESGAMQTGNVTINGANYTFALSGEQINSNTTNGTAADVTDTNSTSDTNTSTGSSGSSGGSGGGSSSSTSSKLSSSSSYSDLYGSWTIKNRINSKMETGLTDKMIALCLGESFTVKADKISSIPATINNPLVDESILTAEEFSDMFGDTLKNLGISGDKIKCITVTDKEDSKYSVDVIISDSGKVYAIVKGTVFALAKS